MQLAAYPQSRPFSPTRSTSGPNLRRLYLPGLEGLKSELRKLDFLLERYLPALTAHLNVRRRRLKQLGGLLSRGLALLPVFEDGNAAACWKRLSPFSTGPMCRPFALPAGGGCGARAVCFAVAAHLLLMPLPSRVCVPPCGRHASG